MGNFKINMISEGIELHQRSEECVKTHHQDKEAIVKETLNNQANILNPEGVDMIDLGGLSILNGEKGWISQEVLNVSVCLLSYCLNIL